ncbi:MAG: hypothetical protein CSB55_06500 [Candidatus Cloacimonadota bacterium]|nr:MAG: hypothetical protein CSB55_06500 [Candidatus Cloacimonadota bacterium]
MKKYIFIKIFLSYVILALSFLFAEENKDFKPARLTGDNIFELPAEFDSLSLVIVKVKAELTDSGEIIRKEIISEPSPLDKTVKEMTNELNFIPAFQGETPVTSELIFELKFYSKSFTQTEQLEQASTNLSDTLSITALKDSVYKLKNDLWHQEDNAVFIAPNLILKENYNYYSDPLYTDYAIRKFGFLENVAPFAEHLQFRTNYPFHHADYSANLLSFEPYEYAFPVTFTDTDLGIGDVNMQHSLVRIRKNELFDVKNLYVSFGFLGSEGSFPKHKNTNSSTDLDLYMSYKNAGGKYQISYKNHRSDLNGLNLGEQYALHYDWASVKQDEFIAGWENKYFYLKYKQNIYDADMINSDKEEIALNLKKEKNTGLIGKKFSFAETVFDISVQHEFNGETGGVFIFRTELSKADFGINLWIINKDKNSFSFESGYSLNQNFRPFLKSEYLNNEPIEYYNNSPLQKIKLSSSLNKSGAGIDFKNDMLAAKIFMGFWTDKTDKSIHYQTGIDDLGKKFNYFFAEWQANYKFKILLFDGNWINSGTLLLENIETLPYINWKTHLKFIWNLRHHNFLTAGIIYQYGGIDYRNIYFNNIFDESYSLDSYISLQITRQFRINLEGYNLLNRDYILSRPAWLNHVNFSIEWLFLN